MSERAMVPATRQPRAPDVVEAYLSHWNVRAEQRRWPLSPDTHVVTIGRSSSTDVCIDEDPEVSRVHATMERVAGHWTLSDDGLSQNGTFVNGRRISARVRLRDRDKIRIGQTVLTFCAPPQTASQQTVEVGALPSLSRLTDAQRAVLVSLCRPYDSAHPYATPPSNRQIAEDLSLSVDAVKTHLRVLFHKCGIEDLPQNQKRARLAELALQLGLVAAKQH